MFGSAPLHCSQRNRLQECLTRDLQHPGTKCRRIFQDGHHSLKDDTLRRSCLFVIYENGRHDPENGFRLCLIDHCFAIALEMKPKEKEENGMDRLERTIFKGLVGVVDFGARAIALCWRLRTDGKVLRMGRVRGSFSSSFLFRRLTTCFENISTAYLTEILWYRILEREI
jgi:hypothetical protein